MSAWGSGYWGVGAWGGCIPGADALAPGCKLQSPVPGAAIVSPVTPFQFRLYDDCMIAGATAYVDGTAPGTWALPIPTYEEEAITRIQHGTSAASGAFVAPVLADLAAALALLIGGPVLPTIDACATALAGFLGASVAHAWSSAFCTGVDLASLRVRVLQGMLITTLVDMGAIDPVLVDTTASYALANPEGGYDVLLTPALPLFIAGCVATVEVDVVDNACNAVTLSWTYVVHDCTPSSCTPFVNYADGAVPSYWGDGWTSVAWIGPGAYVFPVVGAGTPTVSLFTPATGTTLGGTDFTIDGTDLCCTFFNDAFNNAVLNPVLWSTILVGVGAAVTEAPYGTSQLAFSVPALAASEAIIEANALTLIGTFHVEIDYAVQTDFLTSPSGAEVQLVVLETYYNAGNYLRLAFIDRPVLGGVLRCEVWKAGVQKHIYEQDNSSGSGRLGIIRYYDAAFAAWRAAFFWNGAKIFESWDCPECDFITRFGVRNLTLPYAISTYVTRFISHPVVTFGCPAGSDVGTDPVEVADIRIRGKTPPSIGSWAGTVTVTVTNGSGNGCLGRSAFAYTFDDAFVVGRSEPHRPTRRELSVVNDEAMRNPSLDIGHALRRQS